MSVRLLALAVALVNPLAPAHPTVVSAVPSTRSPNITDGTVSAIHDTGAKIIAAGSFTTARNRNSDVDIPRRYVLAFDKSTGTVDTAFAPVVDGEVNAVVAGPAPDTVYLAGRFNTVNGVTRRKLALVTVATGALVPGFQGPPFNGLVNDLVLAGNRLIVGGVFTTAGAAHPRGGLASLDAVTGAVDQYLTVDLTGHHNWTEGSDGARSGVGPDKLALSPDGTQLVVLGNFRYADGVLHDQIVKLDLGSSPATIADWNTDRYTPACAARFFDSWVRDVAFSPDGEYFVVVATGAPYPGTLCDSAARWEADTTGPEQQPTWVVYSGGDTLLSTAVSEQAVYVGGHMRWLNNSYGADRAGPGAVPRPSLAALDPATGLPLSWNPGRHPRGYGIAELYLTADGLWLGHDQSWLGNFQYRRERIAFLPLAGGSAVHPTTVARLPGRAYQVGPDDAVTVRAYDGAAGVGPPSSLGNPDGTPWSSVRGAFWVGGTLFYGMGGELYRRAFDGSAFGPAVAVDPYHDPLWDSVPTDSGQTYAGVAVNFYGELPFVTGMFYADGRLYYALEGHDGLYWRWFTPDSGVVGAERFSVAGSDRFSDVGGVFLSGDTLYLVGRSSGALSAVRWADGKPTGGASDVSGPAIDGVDWRAGAVFVGP